MCADAISFISSCKIKKHGRCIQEEGTATLAILAATSLGEKNDEVVTVSREEGALNATS